MAWTIPSLIRATRVGQPHRDDLGIGILVSVGIAILVQALLVADKKIKTRDSLEAYNNNITRQLNRIFGLDEGDRP